MPSAEESISEDRGDTHASDSRMPGSSGSGGSDTHRSREDSVKGTKQRVFQKDWLVKWPWLQEEDGMRCRLCTNASKPHILEVGVGSGNNLSFLPAECILSCLDPNLENQEYVTEALRCYPGIQLDKFSGDFAEDMRDFADNTFDAVICTFTLCSVHYPDKAIKEIKRVLKPGGLYLFLEHVAAPQSSWYRALQDCLEWVWPSIADGCHLTVDACNFVEAAGFTSVKSEQFELNVRLFSFLKFCLYGYAVK